MRKDISKLKLYLSSWCCTIFVIYPPPPRFIWSRAYDPLTLIHTCIHNTRQSQKNHLEKKFPNASHQTFRKIRKLSVQSRYCPDYSEKCWIFQETVQISFIWKLSGKFENCLDNPESFTIICCRE